MGYSVVYYNDDYTPIGTDTRNALSVTNISNPVFQNSKNLYNGNIKQMLTSLLDTDESRLPQQLNHYEYDQLNRITAMKGKGGFGLSIGENYSASYTYDNNGNLKTLSRTDNNGNLIDDFVYKYREDDEGNIVNNQLLTVQDKVGKQLETDLLDQFAALGVPANAFDQNNANHINYVYDEIGQLIEDKTEGLKIEWRVDGKVARVIKNDGTIISFTYDGLGNRIAKTVNDEATIYARDAQGNPMAVYTANTTGDLATDVHLIEHQIYGSNRLGVEEKDILITGENTTTPVYSMVEDNISEFNWENVEPLDNGDMALPAETNQYVGSYDFAQGTYHIRFTYNEGSGTNTKFVITTDRDLTNETAKLVEQPVTVGDNEVVFAVDNDFTVLQLAFYQDNVFEAVVSGFVLEKKVPEAPIIVSNTVGDKRYELSNHLGNVLSIVTDRKTVTNPNNFTTFTPDVLSYNDYYPFGMLLPGRSDNSKEYRYGFQGQEKDDKIKGEGNSVNYKFRMHDPRVGRFFAVDPLTKKYPYLTPYQFSSNQPIHASELEGLESSNELGGADMANMTAEIIAGAWAGLNNGLFTVIEYLPVTNYADVEGAYIRQYLDNHGAHVPEEVSDDWLEDNLDYRWNYFTRKIEPEKGIAGDIINFGFDVLDVAGAVPGKGEVVAFAKSSVLAHTLTKTGRKGKFWTRNFKNLEKVGEKAWFKYQAQINGEGGASEFRVFWGKNKVDFDGFKNGVLLEAKGHYQWLFKSGIITKSSAYEKMANQFQRQVKAADGVKLDWHFAEESTMKEFKKYLKNNDIETPNNVNFNYTPVKKR